LALAGSSGGHKHTEESKMKMSVARLGKILGIKHSEETKAKLSEAGIGNTNRLGKIHAEETKAKISASQPTAQRVEVIDLDGNITSYYNSIREAAKAIGCGKDTVSSYMKSNKIYKALAAPAVPGLLRWKIHNKEHTNLDFNVTM
jgi:group I intron endonuclease